MCTGRKGGITTCFPGDYQLFLRNLALPLIEFFLIVYSVHVGKL